MSEPGAQSRPDYWEWEREAAAIIHSPEEEPEVKFEEADLKQAWDNNGLGHDHFVHKDGRDDPYYDTHRDFGKVRYSLVPKILVEQAAKVMTRGYEKYGGCTWKETPDGAQRYTESFLRHAMEVFEHGPMTRDEETGMLHIAMAANDAGLAMWHLWKDGKLAR